MSSCRRHWNTQIRQVWWCSTMKTLTDQWTQFEQYTLSHWQPMKVVAHGAGNMIELTFASDESRRCVLNRLKWTKMGFTHAVENAVAVVHAAWNQGVDQCRCSISGQWAMYCTKLSKLVKATSGKLFYILCKRQLTIDDNTKACNRFRHLNDSISQNWSSCCWLSLTVMKYQAR